MPEDCVKIIKKGHTFPSFSVGEWKSCVIAGVDLTDEDRAMINQLRSKGESRLEIDELKEAVRVRAKSWVGVVRLSQFEIHIEPKLPGHITNVLKMLDYASGPADLRHSTEFSALEVEGTSLLELIADRFAQECDKVLRGGLLVDYVEQEEALPYVRGRLLTDRQILRRFGALDRIECSFDDHLTDIPENQILSVALTVCTKMVRNPVILTRASRLSKLFSECCTTNHVRLEWLRRTLVYNRRNAHYAEAHRFAWFLLDSLGISDIYKGNTKCHAFLFDMNSLFQRFMGKWLQGMLASTPCEVADSNGFGASLWDAKVNRPYTTLKPDFLVRSRGTGKPLAVLDAKYKLYDDKNIDIADIYQTSAYAFMFETSIASKPAEAFLLYPTEASSCVCRHRLQMRSISGRIGAVISVIGLHIPSIISDMDNERQQAVQQEFYELVLKAGMPEHVVPSGI